MFVGVLLLVFLLLGGEKTISFMVKLEVPKPKGSCSREKVCVGTREKTTHMHTHARTNTADGALVSVLPLAAGVKSGSWVEGGGNLTGNTLDTRVARLASARGCQMGLRQRRETGATFISFLADVQQGEKNRENCK